MVTAVNQWFPTRMKTKIVLGHHKNVESGLSVYDFFIDEKHTERFYKAILRTVKRDSHYHYSLPLCAGEIVKMHGLTHQVTTCEDFLTWYEENFGNSTCDYGYWIKPWRGKEYSGYNAEIATKSFPEIKTTDIPEFVPKSRYMNVQEEVPSNRIQIYKKADKVFPHAFKVFRITWTQTAVNYPPLTAKFVYERFTEKYKDQDRIIVYDPSMGWAGRIIGAMAVKPDRQIHYLGTDPNTDHNVTLEDGTETTKYADVANHYNRVRNEGALLKHANTFETWCLGSENIQYDERFKKYKGQLDFAFTSPPYFMKEVYSGDKEQSCNRFSAYQDWLDEFLRPTVQTIYDWLKPDRYFALNIADANFSGKLLPLQDDSVAVCESIGFELVDTLKMAIAAMPGANRVSHNEDGPVGHYKNMVRNGGTFIRYEPIFILHKK
jgi:hypothetical protein